MPWGQRQRERMAALLEAQPVQSVCAKRAVLISERTRDSIVEDLRTVRQAEVVYRLSAADCKRARELHSFKEPRGFLARLRWVLGV